MSLDHAISEITDLFTIESLRMKTNKKPEPVYLLGTDESLPIRLQIEKRETRLAGEITTDNRSILNATL
jgi:hypothetical protein